MIGSLLLIALAACSAEPGPAATKYLLLDSRTVERTEGAVLRVGTVQKYPANPLFAEDKPWEVRFDNLYPNVLYDEEEKLYRIWYFTFTRDRTTADGQPVPRAQRTPGTYNKFPARRAHALGYAVSKDGLKWEKPLMDIIHREGQPTNLVCAPAHGAGVLKDTGEKDPQRRYKMIVREDKGMAVRFSPDGLHWTPPQACPEIAAAGDTHNNAFWSPELGKYVGITRLFGGSPRQRLVGRTESVDFLHWTKAVEVLRGDAAAQVYSMPVFRYAGVWLGLPAVFSPPKGGDDRVHTELAWSPDTVHWQRIEPGTPLVPNSARRGDYDWGTVYASVPVILPGEIRIYYGACNGPHTDWRDGFLALATLRPDGFAGYEPADPRASGMVWTRPLECCGDAMKITADAKGGSLTVTVVDEGGKVLLEGPPVTGNVTDQPVTWKDAARWAKLRGQKVRLRLEVRAAKVYAIEL